MPRTRTPEAAPETPRETAPLEAFKEERGALDRMEENDPAFPERLGTVRAQAEVLDERLLDTLAVRIEADPALRGRMEELHLPSWRQISHEREAKPEHLQTT